MRYLILSDIHANIQALEAVLGEAAGRYDSVAFCGDYIGYGANPHEVLEWARREVAMHVRGNHDKSVEELKATEGYNPLATAAILWSIEALTQAEHEWLRALPGGPVWTDGFGLCHGSPADEDEYLIGSEDLLDIELALERPVCFYGHTHKQDGWRGQRGHWRRLPVPALSESESLLEIDPESIYLINPGSVGQPRDRDPRAAYALWDSDARLLTFKRVIYDVRAAQQRILESGLPEELAARLELGR